MGNSNPKFIDQLNKINSGYKIKIRARINSDGIYSLYLDYVNKGKRQRQTLKLYVNGDRRSKIKNDNELLKAKLYREKKERELYESNTGIELKSIDSFIDEDDFLKFFSDQAAFRSDYNYSVSYNNFLDYINVDKLSFKELSRDICKGYKEYLQNLNVKAHTAHHYLVAFKAVINQALIDGRIDHHPAQGIKIKYDDPEIEFLFIDEVKKLIDTPCKYYQIKNGFLFSCFMGLRLSDLNKIVFDDVRDFEVKGSISKFLFFRQKKTRQIVRLKLNKIASDIVIEQRTKTKEKRIFSIPTGGRLSTSLKEWIRSAGITRKLTFHCSRHTFGTLLAFKREKVYTISRLMGHKNIKTTMKYIHIAE